MTTVTFKGNPLSIHGELPSVGSQAPDFDLVKGDLSSLKLGDLAGKKVILNIFPSIDTPTCSTSTKKFNEKASEHENVVILCVSVDLPFAQGRFCAAEELDKVIPVSAFRNDDFGKDYGVVIADGPLAGLFSRAIVLIDESGKVIYTEHVSELGDEPNYGAVLGK
jgi:thioredoxin-dependent peroxiredoxin